MVTKFDKPISEEVSALNEQLSQKQGVIKTKTINATTDSVGDINLGLGASCYPILFRQSNLGGNIYCMLFFATANSAWFGKVINDSFTKVANTSVQGTLFYYES